MAETVNLLDKYPFLKDNDPNTYAEENETWVDSLPRGWQGLFISMCRELVDFLNINGYKATDIEFHQVKEKFGYANIYWGNEIEDQVVRERLREIIETFEYATRTMCHNCGKVALYYSTGWVLPYCKKCADDWLQDYNGRYNNRDAFRVHFRALKPL
jgi:hypothetical protein